MCQKPCNEKILSTMTLLKVAVRQAFKVIEIDNQMRIQNRQSIYHLIQAICSFDCQRQHATTPVGP